MKKIKYIIPILLIFMSLGFAAISVTLSIKGKTTVANTLDDFKVYYSDVKVNGTQDLSLATSETELVFDTLIEEVGDTYKISYDVTNGSKYYDAKVTMTCTSSNEYLSVVNEFNSTDNLVAKETRRGFLTLTKIKTIASDVVTSNAISCRLNATPVERTSVEETTPNNSVNPYYIGREVFIGDEGFNIISIEDNTVTMLAQYNISNNPNLQTTTQTWVLFSTKNGWEYTPGPKEITKDYYGETSTNILNDYISYLQTTTNDTTISIDLITLEQLKELGCTTPEDYAYVGNHRCTNSNYEKWLFNNQLWWTKSADSSNSEKVWYVGKTNALYTYSYTNQLGIRPTITISKELADILIQKYNSGREITIGTEKFNVISDNGITVSMLAQYNLGTDYRQTTKANGVTFADTNGWEYTPGPKEIDIQTWSTNPKTYVNAYVEYLKEELSDDTVKGDLITLKDLEELGCTIPSDYAWVDDSSARTCVNSPYYGWIANGQYWWTRSAYSAYSKSVWRMTPSGNLGVIDVYSDSGTRGIRPVITISKEALNNY